MKFVEIAGNKINPEQITFLKPGKDQGGNDATEIHFTGGEFILVGGHPSGVAIKLNQKMNQ